MVENRLDWCISRQRTWGVPMTLFVHKETEELHPRTLELLGEVAKRVEKAGIQAWWDLDEKELLGVTQKPIAKCQIPLMYGSTQDRLILLLSQIVQNLMVKILICICKVLTNIVVGLCLCFRFCL